MGGLAKRESPGGLGHPYRRVHESGTVVFCGSDRPGQPVVINAPGEVCETWAQELITWSVEMKAWVTRADLAVDVEPPQLARRRLLQLRRDFAAGRCSTSIRRESREFQINHEGATLMLGGRHSELRLRVYDRRGPLRIEAQWRPSRKMGERVPELLVSQGATHVWRMLAGACQFEAPWYRELLEGPAGDPQHDSRTAGLLSDVLQQLTNQYGLTFWALRKLGIGLQDLGHPPTHLRGSQAAKLLSWVREAAALGYDEKAIEDLRQEVERLCERS